MAAAYFAWIMQALIASFATPGSARDFGNRALASTALPSELIRVGAFLALCIGSVFVLYKSLSSGSLVFSIAHIDFLFPTPISRRAVLLVTLIKDYLKYAFWVAFFVMFMGSPLCLSLGLSVFPSGLITIAALTGYLLFVVNVSHTVNIIFTFGYERMKQAGRLFKLVLTIVLGTALIFGVEQYVRTGDSHLSFLTAANSPVLKTIFAPADWCASLALAPLLPVTSTDLSHLPVIWMLALASLGILLSRKENIYEPSLGVSVRASKYRLAMRSGDQTAFRTEIMREKGNHKAGRFTIPPFGRGAVALFWKGILTRYRMSFGQLVLMLVLPVIIALLAQRTLDFDRHIALYLPYALIYIAFVFSITVQPLVRAELRQANILKSMPIAGWKVMLVQSVSGSLFMAIGILVFAGALWALIPDSRTSLLPACAIAAPFLGFACISMTIIPALMYPDTRDSSQNFTCSLIGFMLASLAVIPTIVIGFVVLWGLKASVWAALVPICLMNLIIGAAGVAISGAIFRRFDPTSE